MDDDENLSILLAMGFPDISDIKKALRMAKNDINEAVAILTNDQPLNNEIDMQDISSNLNSQEQETHNEDGFPTTNLYELEQRVFQDNWSIPYKRDESLGKCLVACTKLIKEGLPIENDADCRKFLDSVMPEAFRKLLTSNATSKWNSEIQEGIYNMLELFLDLILVRLTNPPIPVTMLTTLALAFDVENDWNYKNRNQISQGRWKPASSPSSANKTFTKSKPGTCDYGWLSDLINRFGDGEGFDLLKRCLDRDSVTGKEIAAVLKSCANCASLLDDDVLEPILSCCVNTAFDHLKRLSDDELKTKEATSFSELVGSLKLLCHNFRPELEETCDTVRLDLICRMLKTPMFNTRMNGLKEVSRLIDESDRGHYQSGRKGIISISSQKLADWMAKNRVLSVALEGNLDQLQYAERLKAIVEFLGPRLGEEDIDRMWYLLDTSTNSQIIENVHIILATAASKLNLELYEHLTSLIKKKWESSDDRVREKLLRLIGQIGREAKQAKSIEATLQVLWEVSHLESLPRPLLERALSEQLAIITEMNLNKDSHRRTYTNACVDDIKRGKREHVLPAIIHLHKLCKSVSRGSSSSFYQKTDKAFLSELNNKHDIVKLLCTSLGRCHQWGVEEAISTSSVLKPESILDGRYSYEEYIAEHLQLLKFFLQEGNLYLSWQHTKELWETLVDSPRAIAFEKEACYGWLKECISDLESETQLNLFQDKLLEIPPESMTESGFNCFKDYFESVNISEGKLRKVIASSLVVESQELVGHQYLWTLVTNCQDEVIANNATEYLLKMSFTYISHKMRKDTISMHRRFIEQCSEQLKNAMETSSLTATVEHGYEVETSMSKTQITGLSSGTTVNLVKEPSEAMQYQVIQRLLHLAERYVSVVEEAFHTKRLIPPHASTFYGKPTVVKVIYEAKKDEFDIHSHTNELVGMVKRQISEKVQQSVMDLIFECGEVNLGTNKDNCFLNSLLESDTVWNVKLSTIHAPSSSSTALVVYDAESSSSNPKDGRQSLQEEQEKGLPGVMISSDEKIFALFYKLAAIKDSTIQFTLKKLLHLIPSDPLILEELENATLRAAADASPKVSPRKPNTNIISEVSKETLVRLLDPTGPQMSSLRVLYNLEILSGRLLPSVGSEVMSHFLQDFLDGGGLRVILRLFSKDFLPFDTERNVRQSIYVIALQLARYLLCGQGVVQRPPHAMVSTSPMGKPTPPKKSALDHTTMTLSASRAVQKMSEVDFLDMVTCLMGVAWAAGAGDLQLLATTNANSHRHPMRMMASRRSRDSSTGSSTGSDVGFSMSASSGSGTAGGGSRKKLATVDQTDALIAADAFDLLTTCLQLRTQSIVGFFSLPNLPEFIVETLLGSTSSKVRSAALMQLKRLAGIKNSKHLLTKLILKTPVPLWMPSCKARGMSHQILGQCKAYFELRCHLLQKLSIADQEALEENARSMLEDELTFLHSYGVCSKPEDCTLLEGHLRVVEALLSAEGVSTDEVGRNVIADILDSFLFPASKVILEGSPREINPKCDTVGSRSAAYDLLTKLAKGHEANLTLIVQHLVNLHHNYDESLAKEFEFEPLVDRRAACDFVGLKNAGATCYMNSVLQQLYNVPGLCDSVLGNDEEAADEETILYQLQSVFGHLLASKMQYHTPEKFWQTFRLFGQPVNVREQQDAFEFYTQIIDQVDEFLVGKKRPKIFPSYFEGIFSDQKLCQECPHRFEREQSFMALNLTVKSNNLLESLEQFVRGELLDGDNAYFCEKCQEKRSAIKRMCIRRLPKTLVIQLKRFHYDWETNRAVKFDDHFEFPRLLDMAPYTTEGIRSSEKTDKKTTSLAKKTKSIREARQPYDLVGIVVHSGQANAGHYYSFIKNRYSSGDKWFKFNDTTVEEIDMTEDTLKEECFGGRFKVKKSPGSTLPEDRQRYWNAYMLLYESRGGRKRPVRSLTMSVPSASPIGPSRKISMPSAPPRESLSQLSDLLEKGEKTGLFKGSRSQMPTPIEQGIQEENLRFLLRRDVYCDEYYQFVNDLAAANCSTLLMKEKGALAIESAKLATHFLLNSYAHLKKRQKSYMSNLVDTLETYVEFSSETCQWLVNFLGSCDGLRYMRPYLLECGQKDVRLMYARILNLAIRFYYRHFVHLNVEPIEKILETILALIKHDASSHIKHCGQLFSVINKFAAVGVEPLLRCDFFAVTIKLLLGIGTEDNLENVNLTNRQRKWASSQNRELGELHAALANLILACDTTSYQTSDKENESKLCPMPESMGQILYGPLAHLYVREAVSACHEVSAVSVPSIIQALVHVSCRSSIFSDLVLEELLKQYHSINSGELKNLSALLIEVLTLNDELQSKRIDLAIYGGSRQSNLDGLLQLIDQQHTTDSCRAYQCIKTLVSAAHKSPLVKDKLLEDPGKWQWAVNWLREKMDEENQDKPLVSTTTDIDAASNEDSLTRTFHRTTSAVVTLAEANAILAEFDTPMEESSNNTMEIDQSKPRSLDEDEEMPDLLEMKD